MTVRPFAEGAVRGHLHVPDVANESALVLTHGAGGNSTSALLVHVATAFASEGFTVLRFDLPFRQRRPAGPPPSGSHVQDQANIGEAVQVIRGMVSGRIYMGGTSYGGRQATLLAAEKPECADGLLLLSYPPHAPGKTQMRSAHFPALRMPALFVQGSRDAFAAPGEIREAVALIPGRTAVSIVEKAGHDLKSGAFDIAAYVLEPFRKLVA